MSWKSIAGTCSESMAFVGKAWLPLRFRNTIKYIIQNRHSNLIHKVSSGPLFPRIFYKEPASNIQDKEFCLTPTGFWFWDNTKVNPYLVTFLLLSWQPTTCPAAALILKASLFFLLCIVDTEKDLQIPQQLGEKLMTQQEDAAGLISYSFSICFITLVWGIAELLVGNLYLIIYFDTFN